MREGQGVTPGMLYELAQRAVAWWARRLDGLDTDELVQDVTVSLLEVRQAGQLPADEARAYLGRTALRLAQRAAWAQLCPVTVKRGAEPVGAASAARPRAPMPTDRTSEAQAPDEALEAARWAGRVRQRVVRVLAEDEPTERAALRRVLLDGASPAEAAQEQGLAARTVYVVSQRAKRRILRDARVRDLWRELTQVEG